MKKSSKDIFIIFELVFGLIGLVFKLLGFILELFFGKRDGTKTEKSKRHLASSGKTVVEIHGESFYQDAFNELFGKPDREGHDIEIEAKLVREPNNPHDSNAIKCMIKGQLVGHVNRDDAEVISKNMDRDSIKEITVHCFVRGGWERGHGNSGMYGAEVTVPNTLLN